jgi:putative transcriptional regulator
VQDAIIGVVQLAPGAPFPEHTHLGEEKMFIVQGGLRDEDDVLHGPGALVVRAAGTSHAIAAEPGVPLIYLNIVHEGLELFGMRFGPDSAEF